jgi:hypothetical protein
MDPQSREQRPSGLSDTILPPKKMKELLIKLLMNNKGS